MWQFMAGLILGIWIGMIIMGKRAQKRRRGKNPCAKP